MWQINKIQIHLCNSKYTIEAVTFFAGELDWASRMSWYKVSTLKGVCYLKNTPFAPANILATAEHPAGVIKDLWHYSCTCHLEYYRNHKHLLVQFASLCQDGFYGTLRNEMLGRDLSYISNSPSDESRKFGFMAHSRGTGETYHILIFDFEASQKCMMARIKR